MAETGMTTAPLLGEPIPIELMNTIWADRDGVHDSLRTSADVMGWLRAVGDRLSSGGAVRRPAPGLIAEFRDLRDALRRLAAVATDDPRPAAESPVPGLAAAVTIVNRACATAPTWSELAWSGRNDPRRKVRSAGTSPEIALSTIAEQAVTLFVGPDRAELRACHAPGCVLYFRHDHPRREWCSAGCGNRARVARHYQRHRNS
ncbi:MAG TPA: ABATE domain-containing protein [Mycobacteriales bacterium]|jgi:predicted RNA-binding Zn ribbon-like protein|nr:ABATE domain-containing protein [Mycobacteriales bacterium]